MQADADEREAGDFASGLAQNARSFARCFWKVWGSFCTVERVKESVIVVCALSCRRALARRHLYYAKRTNYSPISQFSFFKTVFQTVLRELQVDSKSYLFSYDFSWFRNQWLALSASKSIPNKTWYLGMYKLSKNLIDAHICRTYLNWDGKY